MTSKGVGSLKRRDWGEVEDLPGCPSWLRDAMTGYLQVVIEKARPYDVCAPVLRGLIDELSADHVLDLASGSGGPWPGLREELGEGLTSVGLTLTDIAPSRLAIERVAGTRGVDYRSSSVSALDVPEVGAKVWTMFTGLHHFSPEEVKAIVQQVQDRGVGFAAFEATQRSFRGVLVTLLIPLLVLLMMPLVRPRRPLPLLLTYLPPLLPLVIWWDGLASTMRTYTPHELEMIVNSVASSEYEWRISELEVPGAPIPVLSLVGRPRGVVA